ncbi:hypothetical protein Pmani_005125 [Petrolisthes manimaculis]|uniref:Uncharacterized protein n=1 Tax=Petrolisthes manimaculis TaxID=1843537 RepID=A0AAE1QCG5_9EUCA|nr:hypothetical protein Pmani_005125 [Petrolisthes manimaculis]
MVSEEARNLQGHRFRVVGLEFPPYTNYERDPRGYQFPVTPKPSLDFSILHTMAGKLNFTCFRDSSTGPKYCPKYYSSGSLS